ncbi:hypothetical protein ATANTOWER_001154 [Ataeniobius toweri]|uniref:Uncharacterized protein n=1 Tax=Ataeniobius toweri TaxID=208326 RepID=A0ABU7BDL3_9TELE|nr:hypothetical protein [Ataeniobius toweri]
MSYKIKENTGNLTCVQLTATDTLINKAGGSQSAVSKNTNGKLSRRKKCYRKTSTSRRDGFSLESTVKPTQEFGCGIQLDSTQERCLQDSCKRSPNQAVSAF